MTTNNSMEKEKLPMKKIKFGIFSHANFSPELSLQAIWYHKATMDLHSVKNRACQPGGQFRDY